MEDIRHYVVTMHMPGAVSTVTCSLRSAALYTRQQLCGSAAAAARTTDNACPHLFDFVCLDGLLSNDIHGSFRLARALFQLGLQSNQLLLHVTTREQRVSSLAEMAVQRLRGRSSITLLQSTAMRACTI